VLRRVGTKNLGTKMKVGLITLAFNEERFIKPFLKHIPDWIDEKVVLVSSKPWQGEYELPDKTDEIAKELGATVIVNNWPDEATQRNSGLDMLSDCDWVVVLDPDEFLDNKGWQDIKLSCEFNKDDAYVIKHQRVFYKDKEVSPHTDYQQIILVKPHVRFLFARNVDRGFQELPIELYHFSWARTDKEVWSKISHYSHANEMDIEKWYNEVWLSNKKTDLHPNTPDTLKALIPAKLPPEIERLKLWPK
jgi:glycosyltransferase involved in cell wall biosynthesis